jgi:hypothetical protein
MKPSSAIHVQDRAGWRVGDWCRATSISRSGYYALLPEIAPHSVTIGSRRVIIESPAEWLRRVGEHRHGR